MSTTAVHKDWINQYLPSTGVVLDVGAGVGRDAKYFADKGLDVVAVEPAEKLLSRGKLTTGSLSVRWIADQLPELRQVFALQMQFDLILLSAVWMHIPTTQRERAFRKLTNLMKPGGKMVISLRYGDSPDERQMWPVSVDEIKKLGQKFGVMVRSLGHRDDELQRESVVWDTVVIELPDDGSGAFPVIRNVLINDAKAATYKLALIRTLLRIADGHPGSVLRREENRVILPLGLVSLYWARQFKPILQAGLQQNSASSRGLSFVKADGWDKLAQLSAQDFSVGQAFVGEHAKALHLTLKHISSTIKDNPVKFTTWPGTQNAIFEVALNRTSNVVNHLYLDLQTLASYGEFSVPSHLWQTMSQYACWIEPVAIQEWANVTKSFSQNRAVPTHQILDKLKWIEAEHSTTQVRLRVQSLLAAKRELYCVWSSKKIRKEFSIDHCLPFSRWPNNDLWNLLPTLSKINLQKSDKVPTKRQLAHSKHLIVDWWKEAWSMDHGSENTFFSQAELTLPGLGHTDSYDDVFEALTLQTVRLIDQQQLQGFEITQAN